MSTIKFGEGPGFSPDGGRFWRKDGKIYWSDGDITPDGGIMRELIEEIPRSKWHTYENYSEWSDQKRTEVMAKTKAERDEAERESKRLRAAIERLRERAKTKLTLDEFEAVEMYAVYEERGVWP